MKKNRNDLIGVEIKAIQDHERKGKSGSFTVTIYNGSNEDVESAVIVEADFPVIVMQGKKILSRIRKPSSFAETKPVKVKTGTAKTVLFHWRDVDPEPKVVNFEASFKNSKARLEGFL